MSQPAHSSKIFVRECIIICKQLNPQNICMSLIGFFIIENTYAVIQGNISIFSFSTSEVHYRKDVKIKFQREYDNTIAVKVPEV